MHRAGLVLAASSVLVACPRKRPVSDPARTEALPSISASAPSAEPIALPRRPSLPLGPVRFVLVGGGATPESTEVSLEQDIDLVRRTLPSPGAVLFAGGSDSESVRELDPASHGDSTLVELGELFHPRAGRHSRYRPPRFDAERAGVEEVERRLGYALDDPGPPLLLYVAAHGDRGSSPRENSIALWGGLPLTVARLAEIDEQHSRPLRMVATSCYSGGFAELAFDHADEKAGPSKTPRCGLFAGTWDRETSGCDANPDRRAQESYGLHFIHALGKTDRAGNPLPGELVDFDHDGRVSLLEAHTRARIAALSFDVPTTTSERWLRSVEHSAAPYDRKLLPEEIAVIEQLGAALHLTDEAAALKRWDELDRKLADMDDAMDDAEADLDAREAALQSRLLERWPMIDDPFHPDFAAVYAKNRDAIAALLAHSDEAAARSEAAADVDRLDAELSTVEVEEARALRLKRAYETLHLAASLMRRGGAAARYYQTLLGCERSTP